MSIAPRTDGPAAPEGWTGPETVISRFERVWHLGGRLDIDAALAWLPAGERPTALVELVHVELELRLKAGEVARVEDYLRRYPELAARETVLLGLVGAEWRLRSGLEPRPSREEYFARFPACAGRLHAALDQAPTSPRRGWRRCGSCPGPGGV
jgi:hypothetical protein